MGAVALSSCTSIWRTMILRLRALFLRLEGIDYPCRHHHGGAKLGNDFASVVPSFAALWSFP
jgi:hypothetical protein